jgi:glycosyltransferase involved in cell wall biosynthesis
MSVKICIITTVHPPFDTRIFHKEAKTLVQAGYKVTLIAQHSKNEIIDGVKIVALPKPRNRFTRIFSLTWRVFLLALHQRADIYHFHDPELIFVGIILRFLGKKVIYDVHELVYFQIEDKEWLQNQVVKKTLQLIYLLFERLSIRIFNKIILAESKYEDWFRRHHKNFFKYIIIRNFPILELIDNAEPADYKKNKPIIIYAGGLTRIRGIKEIIQAMEYIGDKAELWLLGKWEIDKFRKECENEKGWKYTKYFDFKPLEEVYRFMKSADIGISILYPVKNYLTSLPVKTYEYMACSLPIVMSDFLYWREYFKESALFANPYDPKEIAERILYLLGNPLEARKMGENVRRAVLEKYNWEAESKKLIMLYNSLLEE